MELKEIQRKKPEDLKTIVISLKITPRMSEWMKENNVSPSLVFHKKIEELMNKK